MHEEYEVIPTGYNEDGDLILHQDSGFCPLFPCPCHEDQELIGGVNDQYQEGWLTPEEATAITEGKNI